MNLSFHHPLPFKFHTKHTILPAYSPGPYSVPQARNELKRLLGINLERGLLISALFHCALLGLYYGMEYYRSMEEEAPMIRLRIMKYSELGPPPSITNSLSAPVVGVAKIGKPTIGTPVPVPDAEINPEQTIATQEEMSAVSGPLTGEGAGVGESIEIQNDVVIENDEPGMNEFVPVEKAPQVVYAEKPVYPEIARRSGMEGTVWVKILVDKTGKARKAVVIKDGGTDIFSDAAITAAMRYQFTPAIMNSGPVQVWVAIKFSFQLTDRQ
ncbi:MAG: energy transducer TonB [Bacteroidetes bacterium]|nr:energy transducer TonB [Bacteroidota bacterium]